MFVNYSPITRDGKSAGAVAVFQDSSDLEAVSQELGLTSELNQELDAILNFSYDELFLCDGSGKILRVSVACERLYGLNASEISGMSAAELEAEGFFYPSVVRLVLEEKRPVTVIQKTKTGRQVIATANPMFDSKGRIVRIIGNSRDITELISLREKLEQAEGLVSKFQSELMELRQERLRIDGIVTESPQIKKVVQVASKVARVDTTVMLLGESGVGKNIIAKLIHQLSERSQGPFIEINCGAIPENLLESELFGYEAGAFTGARREGKVGLIELANRGTLFLNEVGDLPLALQVKLLQVLQERYLSRVGSTKQIPLDVRYIVATNRNLEEMVAQGRFREDLFYRLNVVPIVIPPLRERKEDIVPLAQRFLEKLGERYGFKRRLSPPVVDAFLSYSWPGNIRELENILERLVVTSDQEVITPAHLPLGMQKLEASRSIRGQKGIRPLRKAVEEVEQEIITEAARLYPNTRLMAAALGVNQSTVVRKMKRYLGRDAPG